MKEREPDFSRVSRKKSQNNRLLNIAIGIVALLIIIVASTIIFGGDKASDQAAESNGKDDTSSLVDNTDKKEDRQKEENEEAAQEDDDATSTPADQSETENDADESQSQTDDAEEEDASEMIERHASDDAFVSETIINNAWEPIGTSQTGEHVSLYDGHSVDWNEKKQALAYATGLAEEEMIFWKIKNGGSPQKSIGIVSTRDKAEKYRVYLEWVDGQGWKPVQMDVLTTLDFNH